MMLPPKMGDGMNLFAKLAKVLMWSIAGFAAGVALASAVVVTCRVAGQLLEIVGLR